jgi:hypothetical protein
MSRVSLRNSGTLETVLVSGPFLNLNITLRGTLMKAGLVSEAQQMKQCVYNIPRDCGRCCINETSRPLEDALSSTNIT